MLSKILYKKCVQYSSAYVIYEWYRGESSEKATFEEVFGGDTADVETDFLLGVPFPATFEGLFGGDTVDVETDFPLGVPFPE